MDPQKATSMQRQVLEHAVPSAGRNGSAAPLRGSRQALANMDIGRFHPPARFATRTATGQSPVLCSDPGPSDRTYFVSDLANVAAIGPAASTPHIHMRKSSGEPSHLDAEFLGVTVFEMPELA